MNTKTISAISFSIGAAVGAVGSYIYVKNKQQAEFQKKQEEMIEYYQEKVGKRKPAPPDTEETTEPQFTEGERADMMEVAKKISDNQKYKKRQYNSVTDSTDDEIPNPVVLDLPDDLSKEPYIISDVEFGSQEMYEIETWHLYSDGTVTNNEDERMSYEDVESHISYEAIEQLDASEKDYINVRNDRLQIDFEIIKETGGYAGED